MSSLAWLAHGMLLILFFLFAGALFSSPEPKCPQMFDHQKLSSGRNGICPASSIKVFHVLPTEIPFIEILKPWTWEGGQSEKELRFQRGHLGDPGIA